MDIPSAIVILLFFLTKSSEMSPLSNDKRPRNLLEPSDSDPSCVGNVPICDATTNYPEEEIRRLMVRYRRKYSHMFGNIIEPAAKIDHSLFRSALDVEEESMCRTKKMTVMPKTAYDDTMQKRYIINIDNHIQSVTFEICAETKCFASDIIETLNYQTACQQRYSMVRLLYLNEEKLTIEYGKFSVPSTCVCTYRKLVNL